MFLALICLLYTLLTIVIYTLVSDTLLLDISFHAIRTTFESHITLISSASLITACMSDVNLCCLTLISPRKNTMSNEQVDQVYLTALRKCEFPNDARRLVDEYSQYSNGQLRLANTYDRIWKITSSIARPLYSCVKLQYDSFVGSNSSTDAVRLKLQSGALALVSLRGLLPYMNGDCRAELVSLVLYDFQHESKGNIRLEDKYDILNAKMLTLAGFEDCLVLFDDKERHRIHEKLAQYDKEIQSNLEPGQARHKIDNYEKAIKPGSEAMRQQVEEMVTEVRSWILPTTDKAKNLGDDAWYNEVVMKVSDVSQKICQDLKLGSTAELAYFVTRLASTIQACYKDETRINAEMLGKNHSS